MADMTTAHEQCLHSLEWERSQEQARQKVEDEVEQERVQMPVIDWHDFEAVETIEFADDKDAKLPYPMAREEVIRRPKMSAVEGEVVEPGKDVEMEMDEEKVQLVQEGMRAASLDENDDEKRNKLEPSMRIVKNWKRPDERIPAEIDPTNFVVSPITGELMPINKMAEHMRISLICPKYKEQKVRMMAKIRKATPADDDEISRDIVGLARTRPDIFGKQRNRFPVLSRLRLRRKKQRTAQAGHMGWSNRKHPNQAMSQGLPVPYVEQFDSANNAARNFQGSVGISVSVPNVDEGNPKGQILEISMQLLAETIESFKEKFAGEIQLPANKQKLSSQAGFLKDNMSLAYNNIGPGEALTLSLWEHGSRKR